MGSGNEARSILTYHACILSVHKKVPGGGGQMWNVDELGGGGGANVEC